MLARDNNAAYAGCDQTSIAAGDADGSVGCHGPHIVDFRGRGQVELRGIHAGEEAPRRRPSLHPKLVIFAKSSESP
jgi:hypothetical protein